MCSDYVLQDRIKSAFHVYNVKSPFLCVKSTFFRPDLYIFLSVHLSGPMPVVYFSGPMLVVYLSICQPSVSYFLPICQGLCQCFIYPFVGRANVWVIFNPFVRAYASGLILFICLGLCMCFIYPYVRAYTWSLSLTICQDLVYSCCTSGDGGPWWNSTWVRTLCIYLTTLSISWSVHAQGLLSCFIHFVVVVLVRLLCIFITDDGCFYRIIGPMVGIFILSSFFGRL